MRISPNDPIQIRPQKTAESLEYQYKQAQPGNETSASNDDSSETQEGLGRLLDFLKKKRERKVTPKHERAFSLYRRISTGDVVEKGKLFQTLA